MGVFNTKRFFRILVVQIQHLGLVVKALSTEQWTAPVATAGHYVGFAAGWLSR